MSELETEYYPAWLWQSLFENNLPWNEAKDYSIREFSAKYTLHDAIWITLTQDLAYDNTAILVIRWDAFWLPDEISQNTSIVKDWPILFVKVESVQQISFLGYKDINVQRGIDRDEIEEIEGRQVWVIHDHYGGSVEFVFSGKTWFLGLDRSKSLLKI